MKKAVIALAVATLATAAHAESFFQAETALGFGRYETVGNGTWYQEGMPMSLSLNAPVISLGVRFPLYTATTWGVDGHVAYVNLGHVSSSCFCTSDQNYDAVHHRQINPAWPINAEFTGNGNAQGISATLEPYVFVHGFQIGVEAGLFIYRPSWNESVVIMNNQGTITADTSHRVQFGKVIGLDVTRGHYTVSYKHYALPTRYDSNNYPAIYKAADVVSVSYAW